MTQERVIAEHKREYSEIFEKLKKATSIALSLHLSPDADSVGANLAMYHALVRLGKDVRIISSDPPLYTTDFLPGYPQIEQADIATIDLSKTDILLCIDAPGLKRLTNKSDFSLPKDVQLIVVDHHKTEDQKGDLVLNDPSNASAAELVYKLLKSWNINIDSDIAMCLLTGIVGDTGAFRFRNTKPEVLMAAQELMAKGANLPEITRNLYERMKLQELRARSYVLNRIKVVKEGKNSYLLAVIPYSAVRRLGLEGGIAERIATQYFASVEEVDFGVLLVEQSPRFIKASMRSKSKVAVNKIAEHPNLKGGGYPTAAGFRLSLSQGESLQDGVQEIQEYIAQTLLQ